MRRSIHRTGLRRIAAAVLVLLQSSILPGQTPDVPPAPGGRQIGIVMVVGGIPGEPVSASLVTDFERMRNIQGLSVVTFPVDSTVSLENLVVDTGDGKPQPADQPVLAIIPVDGPALTFLISRKDRPNQPVAMPVIPVDTTPQPEPPPNEYVAPAVPDNGVLQILGPIPGDTIHMHATADNQPARILTSRSGAGFIDTLTATTPGEHELKFYDADGAELFTLPFYAVRTTAVHPNGVLHPGQTAKSSFVLNGPESFPADAWGFVEFHVVNETPEIAVVKGQQDFVYGRQDFLEGPKTVTVSLLALHDGVSRLRGQVRLNVHPVSAAANQRHLQPEKKVILNRPLGEELELRPETKKQLNQPLGEDPELRPETKQQMNQPLGEPFTVTRGTDIRDGDFTSMDLSVRDYLRALGKDPSNWNVTRIPNGGMSYSSPDGSTVLNATVDKGQVVMEFIP